MFQRLLPRASPRPLEELRAPRPRTSQLQQRRPKRWWRRSAQRKKGPRQSRASVGGGGRVDFVLLQLHADNPLIVTLPFRGLGRGVQVPGL
ncbi:MAG: hypothetical protein CMK00_05105 [Planctomycetes bacterium]|nr:hypothetical protein [Planctomycetota bacterium]